MVRKKSNTAQKHAGLRVGLILELKMGKWPTHFSTHFTKVKCEVSGWGVLGRANCLLSFKQFKIGLIVRIVV